MGLRVVGVIIFLMMCATAWAETEAEWQEIEELHNAICDKKHDVAKTMILKNPALLKTRTPGWINLSMPGWSPLHAALLDRTVPLLKFMIEQGADVNARATGKTKDGKECGDGYTPLHVAADLYGEIPTIEFLLLNKADPTIKVNGATALHLVLWRGRKDLADLLLKHGSECDAICAAGLGRVELLKKFLAEDPNLAKAKFSEIGTLLHVAASCGHIQVADLLVKHGADVNARKSEESSWAPITCATFSNEGAMVEWLADAGADVNKKSSESWSILHAAATIDCISSAKALLKKGADVNALDDAGRTALHESIRNGSLEIITLLIEAGAELNQKADMRNSGYDPGLDYTPLDAAVVIERADVAKLLVSRGAKQNKTTPEQLKKVLETPAKK